MVKLELTKEIVDNAEECLKVDQRLLAEGRICGHDGVVINYGYDYTDVEKQVEAEGFPGEVECDGKVYALERMFENGFGIFDLHYRTQDKSSRLMITGMNVQEDSARAILFEARKRNLIMFVGTLEAESLTKNGPELSVQYGVTNLSEDDLECIVVGDTFYSLANIRRYEAVPRVETGAATLLPRMAMDMTYLAIKDRNGPCTDDILTIYNVRNRWALEQYDGWRAAPIASELFESDVCNDCQEKAEEEEHNEAETDLH